MMMTPEGKLMNGQHRCMAVIMADKAICVDIRYNVPEQFFANIDNGRSRDAIQFIKTKNASIVGSVAKFANCIEHGQSLKHAMYGRVADIKGSNSPVVAGRSELLEYVNDHAPELEYIAYYAQRIGCSFKGGMKSMIGNALWLLTYIDRPLDITKSIKAFADDLCQDMPSHVALISGKNYAMSKQLAAARDNVTLKKDFWLGLMLAMYDAYFTRKTKIGASDVNKALTKYGKIVDELRGGNK